MRALIMISKRGAGPLVSVFGRANRCSHREYIMKTPTRLLVVGGMALAFGFCFVTAAAAPADGPQADIGKIADALAKGDMKAAQDQAKAVKADLEDVMHTFSLRTSKGAGVGPTPGAIKPDGIEAKLQNLTKRVMPADLKNDGAALERMAYITAAVAEIAKNHVPTEKKGEKDPAKWK